MTPDERQQAIANLAPLAQQAARAAYRRNPQANYDDLLSDAYLGIIRAVDTHRPGAASINAWAWRICTSSTIPDGYRQRSELPRDRNGRTMHSIEEMRERCASWSAYSGKGNINDRGLQLEAAGEPGYDGVENRAVQCWLFRLARRVLSPHQYWTVEQYYLHGRLLADIGRERGVTDSCVCQTLATAHRKLRAAINERP